MQGGGGSPLPGFAVQNLEGLNPHLFGLLLLSELLVMLSATARNTGLQPDPLRSRGGFLWSSAGHPPCKSVQHLLAEGLVLRKCRFPFSELCPGGDHNQDGNRARRERPFGLQNASHDAPPEVPLDVKRLPELRAREPRAGPAARADMRDERLRGHLFAFGGYVPRILVDANQVERTIERLERVREDREGRLVGWFLAHEAGDEMIRVLKLATTNEAKSL